MAESAFRTVRHKVWAVGERYRWRVLKRRFPGNSVSTGPFAGMTLASNTTGSHLPKLLGSYEAELQPLLDEMQPYEQVIDVGCGEGWYVVGLARRWPQAQVFGYDTSDLAQVACRKNAEVNQVSIHVGGLLRSAALAEMLRPRTLLIVDIEGAEVELFDAAVVSSLDGVDVLVETHDFAVPRSTAALREAFEGRHIEVISQRPRLSVDYPLPDGLSAEQVRRALSENRPPDQVWLWSPASAS